MSGTSPIQRVRNARDVIRALWPLRHCTAQRIAIKFHLGSAKASKHSITKKAWNP